MPRGIKGTKEFNDRLLAAIPDGEILDKDTIVKLFREAMGMETHTAKKRIWKMARDGILIAVPVMTDLRRNRYLKAEGY